MKEKNSDINKIDTGKSQNCGTYLPHHDPGIIIIVAAIIMRTASACLKTVLLRNRINAMKKINIAISKAPLKNGPKAESFTSGSLAFASSFLLTVNGILRMSEIELLLAEYESVCEASERKSFSKRFRFLKMGGVKTKSSSCVSFRP